MLTKFEEDKLEESIHPGIHKEVTQMAKKHPFSHTVVEHHKDGSHTVHHIHEKHGHVHDVPARDGDVKGAAGDHDQMMDHMMDNTSDMNEGEGHDENSKPLPTPMAAPMPPQAAQ